MLLKRLYYWKVLKPSVTKHIQRCYYFQRRNKQVVFMGNINIISLETMKNIYEIMATNLKLAREKGDPQELLPPTKLQPGDTVLIQNHNKGPFDPKYIGDYRVVSLKGNQVEIQPAVGGPTEMKHIKLLNISYPLINILINYWITLDLEEKQHSE